MPRIDGTAQTRRAARRAPRARAHAAVRAAGSVGELPGSLVIGCRVACSGLANHYAKDPTAIVLQTPRRIFGGVVVIGNFKHSIVDQRSEPGLNDTGCHRAVGFHREIFVGKLARAKPRLSYVYTRVWWNPAMNVHPIAERRHFDDDTFGDYFIGMRGPASREHDQCATQTRKNERNRLHGGYSC